jgi:RNA polymerase sigma-70 factor, ECF subfamily
MSTAALSDDELVTLAVSGNRAALIELLGRLGPAVRRRLEGKIDPRWRSLLSEDDVMQETYADTLLSIRRFRPEGTGSFERWLARIAQNNLLDAVRSLSSPSHGGQLHRRAAVDLEESSARLLEELKGNVTTASRDAIRKEAVLLVTRALAQLPHDYREVVRCYDLEGQTAQELSAALGCSQGAMYMRRARALEMLREVLGGSSLL